MATQQTKSQNFQQKLKRYLKWLTIGIGIKRWGVLLMLGIGAVSFAFAILLSQILVLSTHGKWVESLSLIGSGITLSLISLWHLSRNLVAPYRSQSSANMIDLMVEHNKRSRGVRVVAIGGGTGLPATLRALKPYTNNITAIVTVADDGGSSGRLRREMGVLPPGDLRNNIAALADDENLMTRLFQYRFEEGELKGHAFGNLFIATLARIAEEDGYRRNSLAMALIEVERVLNIQGRVLPSTLDDVKLSATIRLAHTNRIIKVLGESKIGDVEGILESIEIEPANCTAYEPSVQAILEAELVVIGPGSLYTSILPNLMVRKITDSLRATKAYKIYVCNVATQPVETENYSVADHVIALEKHIGRGVFQAILANNAYPLQNAGQNTRYVSHDFSNHEILQRYEVRYTDLTDEARPWRHDPIKLAKAIWELRNDAMGIPS